MAGKKAKKPSQKKSNSKILDTKSKSSSVKEPQTMDELLSLYGENLAPLERGQKIKGIVIDKTLKTLVLDINRKSEGLVAEKAFNEARDYIKDLEVGDEVTASVIIPETPEGYTILSLRQAKEDASWEKVLEAFKNGKPLVAYGKSLVTSGITADVEDLPAFIPNSQVGKEASKNPKDLLDDHFKVKVIEADRDSGKIVLSEKEISDAEDIKLVKKAIEGISVGDVYDAQVSAVLDFGCFVEIPITVEKQKTGVEGLVHISELSWEKVYNIKDAIKEGDNVKVKVLGIEDSVRLGQPSKLSLSMKQAQKDPWSDIEKRYKVDSKKKGTVVRVSDFGVFVRLEPGIEGLVHITKIPPGTRLEKDKEVNVYVEEVDQKNRKISLGLVLTAKPLGYK